VAPQSGASAPGLSLGSIFRASLDAVVVMDSRGLVTDWNPAAERTFGYTREEAVGRELAELIIPGPLREAHRNALRRYLETREPRMLDHRLHLSGLRRGDHEFPIELTVTQLPDTEPPVFAGFVRDRGELDAAMRDSSRLQKRLAFLAQAGLALDRSLDFQETLHNLAELTVPELCEIAVIDLLEDGHSIHTAVAAARDPEVARRLEETRRREPLDLSGDHPVARVLNEGVSLVLDFATDDRLSTVAQGPEHLELIERLRYRAAIVVPLIARGHVLGTLSLLRMGTSPAFEQQDLVLAQDLAGRAALAVDNARLFETTQQIARTLQKSLLPRHIPELPGVRITGRYRAAGQGQEVGGDFYDVFEIRPGSWGILIGDVCGKGAEAAALTSLARYTVRALADRDAPSVLKLLNRTVMRDPPLPLDRFLTVIFARARFQSHRLMLEIVSAGHPAPLILRHDGTVETVAVSGPLIGMRSSAEHQPEQVILEPGDRIIMYTDGLTDAGAPERILDEAQLMEILADAHELEGEALAHHLERRAAAGGDPRDDIAILLVEHLPALAPAAGGDGQAAAARR
jgi:PAS domain S-box-containing protein